MAYDLEDFDYYGNRWNEKQVEKTYYKLKSQKEIEKFENYQKANSGTGDCFERNYELFMKLSKTNPHIKYVIVQKRYIASGNKITHAICVDGEFIIDVSQKFRMKASRDECDKSYEILAYNIWDIHNIRPLQYYLNIYKRCKGVQEYYRGNLPKQKGKWEVAKDSIINL